MSPKWAEDIRSIYMSDAANQFIVSGNIYDRLKWGVELVTVEDFFVSSLFGPFDVVLMYDIGRGIRCIKGKQYFNSENKELPSQPKVAMEVITEYLSYVSNNNVLNEQHRHVAVVIKDANLVVPASQNYSNDQNATASLIRDWSTRTEFTTNSFATFLLAENINDLHKVLVENDRAARITIPLPSAEEIKDYLNGNADVYNKALKSFPNPGEALGAQLVGVQINELDSLLKTRKYLDKPLQPQDIVNLKKQIIEKQADGLIEFIESDKTLDDVMGQVEAKKALRTHIKLWKENDLTAIPMGYLLSAPVGVGKTFLVECLAGEAGVPVVRVKNFRTKWVGDTESKQEKIIRLIRALGRCFVFFDEADATLGKRDSDSDGGLSARVYSSWAQEMSNTKNRGKIVWLLASSRADLIEIDLKRPGRIDVVIPLFPSGTKREGFDLLQSLCKREGITITDDSFFYGEMQDHIPQWLTAGAAESLAKKVYVKLKTGDFEDNSSVPKEVRKPGTTEYFALMSCLQEYQPAVSLKKLEEQIRIAANNCTDTDFIPKEFLAYRETE